MAAGGQDALAFRHQESSELKTLKIKMAHPESRSLSLSLFSQSLSLLSSDLFPLVSIRPFLLLYVLEIFLPVIIHTFILLLIEFVFWGKN